MIVYLYFKDKKNIENCEKIYCSFYILVYFSWKTYEGTPIYRPIKKKSIENMLHFCSNSEC